MLNYEQGIHKWEFEKYARLVEHTQNDFLREYQQAELEYISNLRSSQDKTFIDIGAGYGRVLPILTQIAGKVVAVEINKNMFTELRRRAAEFPNVEVVEGNANRLAELLKDKEIRNPVLLLLQNTLGTWEGDSRKLLLEMKQVAGGGGEIVISLLNQEALKSKGMGFYQSIKELSGEPDFEATDFRKGIFRSKSGYVSKWWTAQEREEIRGILGGTEVGGVETNDISIIHVQYPE